MDLKASPLVSIIIPCRNEEKYIGKCLDSIIGQDYPKENLEVLVVDGMSKDKTRENIRKFQITSASRRTKLQIRLLDNPKKFTNFAFNIGIREARGEVIMLMGAHAVYRKDYVSKCLKYLKEYNADNVGGIMKATAKEETTTAEAIALAMSSFFGTGGAGFRTGSKKIKEVDTVFGGCYKREVFDKIGLFNENLKRSQDIEFNFRLSKAGGRIILFPEVVISYYSQADLKDFLRHNFNDGIWITYPLKFKIRSFSWRHLIPLFFILGLSGLFVLSFFFLTARILFNLLLGSYLSLNLFFSFKIALKAGLKYLSVLPIIFLIRHVGYGLGSIWGLIKLLK